MYRVSQIDGAPTVLILDDRLGHVGSFFGANALERARMACDRLNGVGNSVGMDCRGRQLRRGDTVTMRLCVDGIEPEGMRFIAAGPLGEFSDPRIVYPTVVCDSRLTTREIPGEPI